MNLRVSLYETLVNNSLLVRVVDLDNEGSKGLIRVFISNQPPLEVRIDKLSLSPVDVFIPGTPITGKIHEVTVKIYNMDSLQLHDTDIKIIKLGSLENRKQA